MTSLVRAARLVAMVCAALSLAIAVAALVGIALQHPGLAGFTSMGATMKANTAALFILCAVAVGMAAQPSQRRTPWVRGIGTVVAVAGVLTIAEHALHISLGIDQVLGVDPWDRGLAPGRMAPTSAFGFVCIGAGCVLLGRGRRALTVQALAAADLAIAYVVLVGYLYGVDDFSLPAPFAAMAINTALGFLMLGIALVALTHQLGFPAILVDESVAGLSTRRLLPLVFAVPLVIGWLRLQGERLGWYSTEFGLAMMVLTSSAFMVGLVWMYGTVLRQSLSSARSEVTFRGLVEGAPDGMVIVDDRGKILLVNSQTERLFGYARAELLGLSVDVLVPGRYRAGHEGFRRSYTQAPRLRPMGAGVLLYGLRKDGNEFPVEISLSPLETDQGRWISASIRDVSERRQIETALREKNIELEAASLTKDRFLASMSHELRTPLNAIIGFTGTLLMRLPGPLTEDQETQLQAVQTSGRHLLSLINDILDLAKIESGKVELHLEHVLVGPIIDDTVATLRKAADDKGLLLEASVATDVGQRPVRTDARALRQILLNLLGNAVKFTETGRVGLAVQSVDGSVSFAVSDTGVGVRPEDRSRLFGAFQQLEATSAHRHEGTGLGLHLSQRLAGLLGGRIELESEVGRGSTFTLLIPDQR